VVVAVEEAEVTTAVEKRKKMIMTDKILRGDCFFFVSILDLISSSLRP
jgi:hypothetical protein